MVQLRAHGIDRFVRLQTVAPPFGSVWIVSVLGTVWATANGCCSVADLWIVSDPLGLADAVAVFGGGLRIARWPRSTTSRDWSRRFGCEWAKARRKPGAVFLRFGRRGFCQVWVPKAQSKLGNALGNTYQEVFALEPGRSATMAAASSYQLKSSARRSLDAASRVPQRLRDPRSRAQSAQFASMIGRTTLPC
jgi:hypothetical protein